MKKKIALIASFTIASFLVVGQFAFASPSDNMNSNGMMKMMEAMNSPQGQEMMRACGEFMESSENE
ncbi:hypothetical protein [Rossellomorea aquimaris]|uniref:Uncharacterized protein n=1 Tax=Rossellomorea aquimaris TaxID=189382 RepID=A0A366EUG5_9BACI|nr:hypothetical protein [Rossellomorea aquimaris]RBP05330.1 hypothetical protein DET59_10447 [Rossellomorea aquimaris]